MRFMKGILGMLLILVGLSLTLPTAAQADGANDVVSANPIDSSPQVLDGAVYALARVGNRIVVGGDFTQVKEASTSAPTLTRRGLFSFDPLTGQIDAGFAPVADGRVLSLVSAGDGTSVFVGGAFLTINGVGPRSVARLNVSDGSRVAGFNPAAVDSKVLDMQLVGSTLYIGGAFGWVGGVSQPVLAGLNASTGARISSIAASFSEPLSGTMSVLNMDTTPAGDRLVVIGNFGKVNGQARSQIAMFNIGSGFSLADWATTAYAQKDSAGNTWCDPRWDSYMRNVDFSPDGIFFVVTTSGAYRADRLCDSIVRWPTAGTGDVSPTWVDATGGDTTQAVEVVGSVVYIGGHNRWVNNPYAWNTVGAAAVPRSGLAALDSRTGMPLAWNPGRERGVGVFAMLYDFGGLWIGHDTDWVGGEKHPRLTGFPLASGTPLPNEVVGSVPNDVVLLGGTASSVDPDVLYRVNVGGPTLASVDDGPDWSRDTATNPSTYLTGNSGTLSYNTSIPVDVTVPSDDLDRVPGDVFKSERYDFKSLPEMSWAFPVAAGQSVDVRVYFSGRSVTTVGGRVFSMTVEGQSALTDFDVVAAAGANVGVMRATTATSDGVINLSFLHGAAGDPQVNAIEIVRAGGPRGAFDDSDRVTRRFFDGAVAVPRDPVTSSIKWSQARGAFLVDGVVYTPWADGTMRAYGFDNAGFGSKQAVDLYPVTLSADGMSSYFGADAPYVTGIVYDGSAGRIYYTMSTNGDLRYRYFSADSRAVGARAFQATGDIASLSPSRVQGMFLSGTTLYFADRSTGALYSVGFNGGVVSGPAQLVDDTMDWRSRGSFLWSGTPSPPPNVLPAAAASVTCSGWQCAFDGTESRDSDGTISSYAWDFGDGSSGTGATPTHRYDADGLYTVVLTVTDNRGGKATTQASLNLVRPANHDPLAVSSVACEDMKCVFDGSASTDPDPDGSIDTYSWDFGDGQHGSGPKPSHAYTEEGDFTAVLTVTDDRGGTATSSLAVHVVAAPASQIAFRDKAGFSGNVTSAPVKVPSTVHAGDALLLFVTTNTGAAPSSSPAGWTLVGEKSYSDMRTQLLTRVATASDIGKTYSVGLPALAKVDLTLLAYTGTDAANPIAGWAAATESMSTTAHTAPSLALSTGSSWVVSFWADKTSSTTGWVVPATLNQRSTQIGSGSGRLTSVSADTAAPVAKGIWPGALATASAASNRATMWTVALKSSASPISWFTYQCQDLDCAFDGSASTDPDGGGAIVEHDWDFGDGETGSGVGPTHSFPSSGTYAVSLTVKDASGATDQFVKDITVRGPNVAPTAAFSLDCDWLACTFDGSASTDPDADGSVVDYSWDFGDGVSGTGMTTSHMFASEGQATVTLTVTDDRGGTGVIAHDVELVRAPNSAPQASFKVSCSGMDCDFDASGSSDPDPDGAITSYAWDFGDGSTATGVVTSHAYQSQADVTVTLTVTDDRGGTDTAVKTVTVQLPNTLPSASFSVDCTWLVCSLDATSSADADGTIEGYHWEFGDGSTGTGVAPSHTYPHTGTFDVVLTVTDDRGGTATHTHSVGVESQNQAPVASATSTCDGLVCEFDGSGSADPDADGHIVSYTWDFGDGTSGSGPAVSHTYGQTGAAQASLTVVDDRGDSDSVAVQAVPKESQIAFRDKAIYSGNVTSATIKIPSTVQVGDAVLLFVTTNTGAAPTGGLGAWTLVGEKLYSDMRTQLYMRVAASGDAGKNVTVTLPAIAKTDLTMLAYSGTDSAGPVAGWAGATETTSRTVHTAPSIEVANNTSWVVSYWADKSSATTSWTLPAGQTQRSSQAGTAGGRITSIGSDTNSPAGKGTWAGVAATANSSSSRATMWSIALKSK